MASSSSGVKTPDTRTAVRQPLFRVESVTKRTRYLKLLVYGNYGVGKTTLAASACDVPQMNDVLLINAEAGDLSLEQHETLDAISVQDFKTLARVTEFLKAHCKARDADDTERLKELEEQVRGEEVKDVRRYRTVIIDSLSEVETYCMNQLLGITDSTKVDEETQSAEWAEYKQNHSMIQRLVRTLRDLPMHVIFICAEQYSQDEMKKYRFTPDLTGKLSKKVQGFMDMVGYLVVGQPKEDGSIPRRLYVTPSGQGRYDAKHRYSAFKGAFFDEPTLGKILKEVGIAGKEGAEVK